MTHSEKYLYPLKMWGVLFLVVGGIAAFGLIRDVSYGQVNQVDFAILGFISIWFCSSSIGLFLMKRWGFILSQINIAICFLAFPVGTYLAFKTNQYIKANNVANYFT